jgi:hypothetical protein
VLEASLWLFIMGAFVCGFGWLVRDNRRRARRTNGEFERDVARWKRVKHLWSLPFIFAPPRETLPSTARPVVYDAEPAPRRRGRA